MRYLDDLTSIYIICPVSNALPGEQEDLDIIVDKLEKSGYEVYYPGRDTDQYADIVEISQQNSDAIREADIVLVYFRQTSRGSLYDLGFAVACDKPICLIDLDSQEYYGDYLEQISDKYLERRFNGILQG